MTEQKFTKGKWQITDKNPNGIDIDAYAITAGVSGDYWDVCAVWKDLSTQEECKANANLIAAAPELLEALRHCLDVINVTPIPESLVETYGNMVMNYESLINQATTV